MIGALTDGSSRRGRLVARAVMLALVALLSASRSPAAVTQAGQPGFHADPLRCRTGRGEPPAHRGSGRDGQRISKHN